MLKNSSKTMCSSAHLCMLARLTYYLFKTGHYNLVTRNNGKPFAVNKVVWQSLLYGKKL